MQKTGVASAFPLTMQLPHHISLRAGRAATIGHRAGAYPVELARSSIPFVPA
jgi:hypothetical protein